jgi:hypothetical protein
MISISAEQLRRAASIKDQIESLQSELDGLLGSSATTTSTIKGGMSAAGKARIAAAQRARWAKLKGTAVKGASKGKRKMSPAARAKIAAAARARWKKAKAAGKNSL